MTAAAVAHHHSKIQQGPPLTLPLTKSMIFHGIMIVLIIFGIPFVRKDIPITSDPVPVELVNAADLPEAVKTPDKVEKVRDQEKTEKPPPPKPQMPTVMSPPKPVAPAPLENAVAMPKEEKAPEPAKKPETKLAPKPLAKKPMLTRPAEDEQQEKDFQSLLVNMMKQEPTAANEDASKVADKAVKGAPEMTTDEMAAVKQQLNQCWSVLAGARYAEDLIVQIRLYVNPDRTIQKAEIVDQFRYMNDSFFRAAADSSMRALYNPYCNPLDLPPDKYDTWKTMTITFDPRKVL